MILKRMQILDHCRMHLGLSRSVSCGAIVAWCGRSRTMRTVLGKSSTGPRVRVELLLDNHSFIHSSTGIQQW